jgi:hypothetical protein
MVNYHIALHSSPDRARSQLWFVASAFHVETEKVDMLELVQIAITNNLETTSFFKEDKMIRWRS